MTSRTDVAKWMIDKVDRDKVLHQADAVIAIERKFGRDWVHENASGILGIDRTVLTSFAKLHRGRIAWDSADRSWSEA